jgi:hypothetical protein
MNEIVNLIYVILFSVTVLLSLIGAVIALYRSLDKNSARIDNIDKHYQEQIAYLKGRASELESADKGLKELIEQKNDKTLEELKKLETKMGEHFKLMERIETTLGFIINGRLNLNQHDENHRNH